jgi:L-2-hydroxyglutarate oxidase LhgO
MKIIISTENRAKVEAVESVFKQVWPDLKIISEKFPSDVADQPLSEEKRNEAGRLYFELLLKKESERGRFKLKSEVKDTGPVSHPDDSF